jgi:hypothetical protein
MLFPILGVLLLLFLAGGAYVLALRHRHMHLWLGSYYFPSDISPAKIPSDQPLDVYIAVCDHYEPQRGGLDKANSIKLVQRWVDEYPALFDQYRDSSGRVPQHTFFFPQDEYQPEYLDLLKGLCDRGYGDVDVHLHHRHDTADSLHEKLDGFRNTLYYKHGLLRRDPISNEIVYGFIHGNWALCNSRPDGDWCGVDQELSVLLRTGCYADFTLPSAPSPTQTAMINSIYYAWDRPGQCKSHNVGQRAAVGRKRPARSLLMIQGPLAPNWAQPRYGIFPRIENGDIHAGLPPTLSRFKRWKNAHVHVQGRPDSIFVKLHTHGCKEGNIDTWLGPQVQKFHHDLHVYAAENPNLRYHYVTAWEMALLVRELEAGPKGQKKLGTAKSLPQQPPR